MAVSFMNEHQYGISRAAILSRVPDMTCVRNVLNEIEDIKTVHETAPPQSVLVIPGSSWVHGFRCEGERFWVNMAISRMTNGQIEFSQVRLTIDTIPSNEELQETRRIMLLVEQRLISSCGISELQRGVHEKWFGVKKPG